MYKDFLILFLFFCGLYGSIVPIVILENKMIGCVLGVSTNLFGFIGSYLLYNNTNKRKIEL